MIWLLIIQLHTKIEVVPFSSMLACIERAQHVIDVDDRKIVSCVLWQGGEA